MTYNKKWNLPKISEYKKGSMSTMSLLYHGFGLVGYEDRLEITDTNIFLSSCL